MSRIGKRPIPLPRGVQVTLGTGEITVSGPKGSLTKPISPQMIITVADDVLTVERPTDSKEHRSLHGLTRTIIANMVEGVTNGYSRTLEVHGVGYRSGLSGRNLTLAVGFSHGIERAARPVQRPSNKNRICEGQAGGPRYTVLLRPSRPFTWIRAGRQSALQGWVDHGEEVRASVEAASACSGQSRGNRRKTPSLRFSEHETHLRAVD